MVDRYATIMYYITRAKHKRAHNLIHAIDGARTRGLDLGKVARYQLRHYRICLIL